MSSMTIEERKMARIAIARGGKDFAMLDYQSDWKWKEDPEDKRLTHMEAEGGKVDLAGVLADAGHSFEEQDRKGRTSLLACLGSGVGSEEMLNWLVSRSAKQGKSVKGYRSDGVVHGGRFACGRGVGLGRLGSGIKGGGGGLVGKVGGCRIGCECEKPQKRRHGVDACGADGANIDAGVALGAWAARRSLSRASWVWWWRRLRRWRSAWRACLWVCHWGVTFKGACDLGAGGDVVARVARVGDDGGAGFVGV